MAAQFLPLDVARVMAVTVALSDRAALATDDVLDLLLHGQAHSREPAVLVRTRIFARSREEGRVLQFWVADERLVDGYVESDAAAFWGARGYSRTVVMARLSTRATCVACSSNRGTRGQRRRC